MISPNEAARLIGCTPKHVRQLCMRGELEGVRLGKCWHVNRQALMERLGLSQAEAIANE
ncbi:helix-turn-helix domain-containing protein [Olsenella sp. DNF00959]|uniref:helix-turn-helix domain-containing protein n=1 Tax=Olsenella sp. DNF00959 TaxID=1476999 RepID=UPI0007943DF4|nr:helix-turn-helix domain-containing protein [Olsenella sp. DNF00959]KXB63849.1 DNA binding domain, excisionase family [Olsenella sp. DNF00959]